MKKVIASTFTVLLVILLSACNTMGGDADNNTEMPENTFEEVTAEDTSTTETSETSEITTRPEFDEAYKEMFAPLPETEETKLASEFVSDFYNYAFRKESINWDKYVDDGHLKDYLTKCSYSHISQPYNFGIDFLSPYLCDKMDDGSYYIEVLVIVNYISSGDRWSGMGEKDQFVIKDGKIINLQIFQTGGINVARFWEEGFDDTVNKEYFINEHENPWLSAKYAEIILNSCI